MGLRKLWRQTAIDRFRDIDRFRANGAAPDRTPDGGASQGEAVRSSTRVPQEWNLRVDASAVCQTRYVPTRSEDIGSVVVRARAMFSASVIFVNDQTIGVRAERCFKSTTSTTAEASARKRAAATTAYAIIWSSEC